VGVGVRDNVGGEIDLEVSVGVVGGERGGPDGVLKSETSLS